MTELDVIIIGAGPAGLSAAIRLHSMGHRVAVVTATTTRTCRRLETVPRMDVITHAFPGLDLTSSALVDIARAGVSWWTGEQTMTREVSVLDRGNASESGLDAQLLSYVARAGVDIHVVGLGVARASFDQMWHVSTPSLALRSRFVIDASGRHSPLRQRRPLPAWRQIVITGELRAKPDLPGLWTESLPDGWLWAIRDRTDRCLVSYFVAPSSLSANRESLWEHSLMKSRLADKVVSLRSIKLHIQEATPAATDHVFARGLLHLGDAALTRCPLASQGLSAAISDGQSAAIGLHNLLQQTAPETLVHEFLECRHHQAVRSHMKFLAASYAATPFETPYWLARGDAGSKDSLNPVQLPDMDQPMVLSPSWQVRAHPTLDGDSICFAPCLCSADESLRWIAGCLASDLLAPVSAGASASFRALLQNWAARHITVGQRALQISRWLVQRRVLVPSSTVDGVVD